MKPEKKSQKVLKYTQSIAKMIEFNVPESERSIIISNNPEELFTLVIGLLGDFCNEIITSFLEDQENNTDREDIRFCANFFDAYKNTNRISELNNYYLLVGAASYYLCDLPGSAKVLIQNINSTNLDLSSSLTDKYLYWLLSGNYTSLQDYSISFYSKELSILQKDFLNFINAGVYSDFVLFHCKNLRDEIYKTGLPREIFFADLIFAISIKKIETSCWTNIQNFTGIDIKFWTPIIEEKSFIKEFWPAQMLLGKEGVFKGQSAVIQMPTSAGKTKSTELIIRSAFLSKRTSIAVIVVPFKALCHEIKEDYIVSFKSDKSIKIDEISDVFETEEISVINDDSNKHILIFTPEKLYYLLSNDNSFLTNIGLIIFDEAHQFDSGERGVTYELLITELRKYLPIECQKIMISAVIHNAEEISRWFSDSSNVIKGNKILPTQRNIGYVNFDYGNGQINFIDLRRPDSIDYFVPKILPIIEMPKLGREQVPRYFPNRNDSKSIALALGISLSKIESTVIFCGTKTSVKSILTIATEYIKRMQPITLTKGNEEEINKISYLIKTNFGENCDLYKCAKYGIFAHHADIPHGIKMSIEFAMHESLISFIICTSTLAQGVNLPIKYLLVMSTQQGKDKIKVRDFNNLIGRVGRSGMLTEGSIIFTNPNTDVLKDIKRFFNPENEENCISNLLSIVEPIKNSKDDELTFQEGVKSILGLYYFSNEQKKNLPERLHNKFPNFSISEISKQLNYKFSLIEKVENFLMLFGNNLSSENINVLAEDTLAYFLGTEEEKKEVHTLFEIIGQKLQEQIEDKEKLPVYAKALRGLNQTLLLEEQIIKLKESLLAAQSINDFIECIWPICLENINNSYFIFYCDKEKLKAAVLAWVMGKNYEELFNILKGNKINGRDYIDFESCVNIFENGFGYNGSVLLNSITEILSIDSQLSKESIDTLLLFQKQIKYGLPSTESIWLYEFGFCDRVIAQELAQPLPICGDKYTLKFELIKKLDIIKSLLNKYPSYYSNVLDRIVNS